MSKYSKEFKLQIVKYYLEGNDSIETIANKFGLPNSTPLKEWIRKYQKHGPKGLIKHQKSSYSGEFKENVIKYMHSNHLSARETAVHFRLSLNAVIKWERVYYEEGPQAFYLERRGRQSKMSSKTRNKKLSKENKEDLIEEVQRLRMENEYLKKLNALVQERIKLENKKK